MRGYRVGAVAGLVGIEDGVVSGVINLESSGVEVPTGEKASSPAAIAASAGRSPTAAGIRSTETTASTLITNSGAITVTGSGASPDFASGVLFQAGAAGTLINQASGTVSSATDSGVRGADANITVRNAGTIGGGNGIAINLGNGNDIIQVTAGQINGAIVTGTGNDPGSRSCVSFVPLL
jgi:hypothetical protein